MKTNEIKTRIEKIEIEPNGIYELLKSTKEVYNHLMDLGNNSHNRPLNNIKADLEDSQIQYPDLSLRLIEGLKESFNNNKSELLVILDKI